LKFLFLEPFFGGSHQDFAEGLVAASRHQIELVTLPARFWKWRMRGAALYFLRKLHLPHLPECPSGSICLRDYDGIITSDLMSLSDLKSLAGSSCPPALVYFHENQITYPLAPGEHADFQFGFTNITTGLAADRVLFNSRTHFDAFFSALPNFIGMMPEFHPKWVTAAIQGKSGVLHPGCRFPRERESLPAFSNAEPPLIIWNHRWEFDKNPESFFRALDAMVEKGLDFRLALLGENFQVVPKPFICAKERYEDRVIRYGHIASREEYIRTLRQGTLVISTALQENFGISVVEAIRYGCLPLLPDRLSYPEVLPREFHDQFLYADQSDLEEKLSDLLVNYCRFQGARDALSQSMGRYAWKSLISQYDKELETLTRSGFR
jgi:glycosyltransferase involved in cell wall biosynthesis